jgi:hypothetical protein
MMNVAIKVKFIDRGDTALIIRRKVGYKCVQSNGIPQSSVTRQTPERIVFRN